MRTVTLQVLSPATAFGPISVADTAWTRIRGLLGRAMLHANEGMLIKQCSSVHTVGMRYPIDIVFLRSDGYVLRVVSGLQPFRLSVCYGADMVLELSSGRAQTLQLKPGIQLFGW